MSVAGQQSGPLGLHAPGRTSLPLPGAFSPTRRLTWIAFGASVLTASAAGFLYGAVMRDGRPLAGALYGAMIGGAVMAFELGLILPRLRDRLRRLPWSASVVSTEVVYLCLVLVAGAWAGVLAWEIGLVKGSLSQATVMTPPMVLYSLVVSGIVITLNRMRDLIGPTVFRNVLLGRYHRPVEEERIFLFVDLIGSTAYAQTHGDLRAQAFLGAIFAALSRPVRDHGGEIEDYVGDMALVTWPMRGGTAGGRCLACVFAFVEAIEAEAERWRQTFGEVPRFRAALHGGSVVTAEVGVDRHKIAYFGDVVNTTGRLEALCRTLDSAVLISADLYRRLPGLPDDLVARPMGEHALKGRGQLLEVWAVTRSPDAGQTAAA